MKVTMMGHTEFGATNNPVPWEPEGDSGQDMAEFAGRACYQSWNRPNPATATNEGYLKHILEVQHESVLEHGSVTFYVEGCSRSLTHELIRHRHFSYSQLSQRFVVQAPGAMGKGVVPPLFRGDSQAETILSIAWFNAMKAYDQLIARAEVMTVEKPDTFIEKKRIREAARAVLPNMTPTAIVLTGNHRAWREAIVKRASLAADAEICELFVEVFKQLRALEPNIYQDMHVCNDGERSWVCACGAGAVYGARTSHVHHDKFAVTEMADPESWKTDVD